VRVWEGFSPLLPAGLALLFFGYASADMPTRGERAAFAERPGAAEMLGEPPATQNEAGDPAADSGAEPAGTTNENRADAS
jgi:hypothetical protein